MPKKFLVPTFPNRLTGPDFDRFVEALLPFARSIAIFSARRIGSERWASIDDIISYAHVGLLDACKKVDKSRYHTFKAFAEIRIRGEIIDLIRKESHGGRAVQERLMILRNAIIFTEQELGRSVNISDVENVTLIPRAKLEVMLLSLADTNKWFDYFNLQITRLSGKLIDEDSVSDTQTPSPFEIALNSQLKRVIFSAFAELAPREKKIVYLRYFKDLSVEEIAQELGVSQSRVSQLHKIAINRLRHILREYRDVFA